MSSSAPRNSPIETDRSRERWPGSADMSQFENPFFVISAPRSGSTLLRLILDAHPALAVPPPAWLFEMVYPFLYSYGDLTVLENARALAEDILETPTVKKWPIDCDPDSLLAAAPQATFAGFFDALHRIYAESTGKSRWGEKTPRNCFWVEEILSCFPDARFIHIVRDGRDMAIDIANSSLWPYSVYAGAEMWQQYVASARASGLRIGVQRYFEIHYEALCMNPERSIREVCNFLAVDFDPVMLSHHLSASARQWASDELHEKTSRPITTQYCGMYKRRLNASDRAALEALLGSTLASFGYRLEGETKTIPARAAAQLLNNDRMTNPANVAYKEWHAARRRERRDRGVWQADNRDSQLWALD